MAEHLPVIAAVPNYNMAKELGRLLPQLIAQPYDEIVVLDDCSSDDSREIVSAFNPHVQLVAGESNIGSAGNRNRILEAVESNAILHFLDADVELVTDNIPKKLRELFKEPDIGFIGGVVTDPNGKQSPWNYGPLFGLSNTITSNVQYIARDKRPPLLSRIIEHYARRLLKNWPNPNAAPCRREVGWVLEANMAIERDVFVKLGAFDPHVQDHDIVDLSIKAHNAGLKSYFDPSFTVVQHSDNDVRQVNRQQTRRQATRYLCRKYGLLYWLMPK